MIIGSLPFVIFLKMVHGEWKTLFKDDQIKLFFLILIILILITSLWLNNNNFDN